MIYIYSQSISGATWYDHSALLNHDAEYLSMRCHRHRAYNSIFILRQNLVTITIERTHRTVLLCCHIHHCWSASFSSVLFVIGISIFLVVLRLGDVESTDPAAPVSSDAFKKVASLRIPAPIRHPFPEFIAEASPKHFHNRYYTLWHFNFLFATWIFDTPFW